MFSAGSQQRPLTSQQRRENLAQSAELLPHHKLQNFSRITEDPLADRTGHLEARTIAQEPAPRHHFPLAGTVVG